MTKVTRYALALAGGYVAIMVPYIVFSGGIAARFASSVEHLERVERYKGIAFVATMALLLFFAARFVMRRLQREAAEVLLRERALRENEGRVMAGLTAASIAHDSNNVLMAILGELEEIESHWERRALEPCPGLVELREATSRLVALNARLSRAGRSQGGAGEELDLALALRAAVSELRRDARVARCDLRLQAEGDLRLRVRPILLHQIVSNLVINAAEAVQGAGVVEVKVRRSDAAVELEVHDAGPGVPPDRRATIFEAMESTKHQGDGLGLFSVKACAQAIGARVSVGASPLGGACFRVELPAPAPADERP